MTQPTVQYELPPPSDPVVTRVITNGLFPEPIPRDKQGVALIPPVPRAEEPLSWVLGAPHPQVDDFRIVRMFRVEDGVDVYSVSKTWECTRNLLPWSTVRFVEETMSAEFFVEEIRLAEAGDDPDEPSDLADPGDSVGYPPGDPGDGDGDPNDGTGDPHDAHA
jgi:hypothetical protein